MQNDIKIIQNRISNKLNVKRQLEKKTIAQKDLKNKGEKKY